MTNKQILRAQLLAQIRKMDPAEAGELSRDIAAQVIPIIDWPSVASLHIYLPLKNEVDTRPLLHEIRQANPEIKIASWQKTTGGYRAFWLGKNGFGGAVPAGFEYDVIIVPALGFTNENFRLGRGGGFYDRFLADQPRARTVGLCYSFGRCSFAPEPHDIPLLAIIANR